MRKEIYMEQLKVNNRLIFIKPTTLIASREIPDIVVRRLRLALGQATK
jgi:hypothetical protein